MSVRFAKWAFGIVGAALLAWGAVDAARWTIDQFRSEPATLAKLQTEIVSRAARSGYLVADARTLDLKGTGQFARLYVFRKQGQYGEWLGSDELRIYDLGPHRLTLRLSFKPSKVEDRDLDFDVLRIRKIGGRQVVLGSFHEIAMGPFLSIPVVIDWDPARDRYRIKPILAPVSENPLVMPRLFRLSEPGDYAAASRHYYLTPVWVQDTGSRSSFRSYTTEDSTFIRDRAGDVLLGAFIVSAKRHVDLPLLQVAWWRLDILGSIPLRYPCLLRHPRQALVKPRLFEGFLPAALRTWARISAHEPC
jgi:hypothetical protein